MKFRLLINLLLLAMFLTSPSAVHADTIGGKDTINDYLSALEANPNDKNLLKTIAFYYMNIGEREKSQEYARRLLKLGEVTGDRDFCELYGRIVMGSSLLESKPQECFKQLEEARMIAEGTGNHDALLSVNNSFGMYYMFLHNDLYTASSYYYRALEDAKAIRDERRYGIILSNLAGVYLMMNDVSGQKLAEQSHEIALKRGEPIPLYYAKDILTHFYILSDSLDRVEKLIGEVEQLHRDGGFEGEPNTYLVKARLAEKRGNISEAYSNYAFAMENFKHSDPSEIAATYLAYARLLRRDKNVGSAIKVLEYGLETSDSSTMRLHSPEIIRELVYAYRDAGNYEKALEYSMKYQAYQDSIFKLSRERALQENRIRHEVYAKERLIDEQRVELMATRHRNILLVVIVLAILTLLGLTYYNYRKKDRLYRAIVLQNREYLSREQLLLEQIEKSKEHKSPKCVAPLAGDKADDLLSRFTVLMTEKKLFKDPSLTVGTVAEHLDSNRTYVSRAINESTGKSFTQIVNEYRIREAISLISDLEANMPLKQVCSEVGFNSISTFYSTFQAITGMTPARYRAQLREI